MTKLCITNMKIGYINSTASNTLPFCSVQGDESFLLKYECDQIHIDVEPNKKEISFLLAQLLESLETNDSLVVNSFFHLAGSLNQLVPIFEKIRKQGAHLVCLSNEINSEKNGVNILDELVLFQRQSVQIRTAFGLKAARSRGLKGGRPGLSSEKIDTLNRLYADPNKSIGAICEELEITRSTLYKYVIKDVRQKAKND